jgi:2-keto-4-pentenoate hydratase/2-oxohepta-3-ene-1,7-dioic acid hydratase in catechol pathway
MKIIRFEDSQGHIVLGRPLDDTLQIAERLEGDLFGALRPTGENVAVARLLAPLDPPNILCVGLNYHEHAKETKMDTPERPVLFIKPTTTLTDPGASIPLPVQSYQVDWEGELVIVIGRTARDVSEDDALQYVLGYTIANDVSARDWQMHLDKQWARGKSFDGFCPLGPALVTAADIPDTGALFLVSYLSRGMTLLPGTVILTGSPPGVGLGLNPPKFLRPGDVCEVEIEGIGTLRNTFVM